MNRSRISRVVTDRRWVENRRKTIKEMEKNIRDFMLITDMDSEYPYVAVVVETDGLVIARGYKYRQAAFSWAQSELNNLACVAHVWSIRAERWNMGYGWVAKL